MVIGPTRSLFRHRGDHWPRGRRFSIGRSPRSPGTVEIPRSHWRKGKTGCPTSFKWKYGFEEIGSFEQIVKSSTCYRCETRVTVDDINREIDNYRYRNMHVVFCSECYHHLFKTCTMCGATSYADDVRYVYNNLTIEDPATHNTEHTLPEHTKPICIDCFISNNGFRCVLCHNYGIATDRSKKLQHICDICVFCEKKFARCRICKNYNLISYMHIHKVKGNTYYYCSECFETLPTCIRCGSISETLLRVGNHQGGICETCAPYTVTNCILCGGIILTTEPCHCRG